MIKTIDIQNFQSHKDSSIDFSPGITAIVGSSNCGKTAIFRAVNWVLNNKPSSDAFVSHFVRDSKGNQKSPTTVRLTLTDGVTLTRERAKDFNRYRVNETEKFDAIGLEVPESIKRLHNMSEANVQKQLDAPFLLSNSAGEVARFFNEIVGFDKIDEYLSKTESKKRKTKADLELYTTNKAKTEQEIKKYEWIDEASILLQKIDAYYETINALVSHITAIRKTIQEYTKQIDILGEVDILSSAVKKVNELTSLLPLLKEKQKQYQILLTSRQTYLDQSKNLGEDIDTAYAEKLVNKIGTLHTSFTEKKRSLIEFSRSIQSYTTQKDDGNSINEEIIVLKNDLPNTCPYCGQELKEDICG